MDNEEIKAYWEHVAQKDLDDDHLRATARDPYLQQTVEWAMERYLYDSADLIDIGCGDGLSTMRFAQKVRSVTGIDYIPAFLQKAEVMKTTAQVTNVAFALGDVRDLSPFKSKSFDIAITIRCLINLSGFADQTQAIAQIASVVETGGLYLASEGWAEGFQMLNVYRKRAGLEAMSVSPHNCLIKRSDFEEEVRKYFDLLHYENLGFYLYLSRVVQPLWTHPAPPSHTHPLNRIAANLWCRQVGQAAFEECDYAGVYVLRKK